MGSRLEFREKGLAAYASQLFDFVCGGSGVLEFVGWQGCTAVVLSPASSSFHILKCHKIRVKQKQL